MFIIAVVPLERDLDADAGAFAADRDRIGQQRCLVAVEPFDEGRDAAFLEQVMHDMLGAARVDQLDADARIQEGELAIAVLELLEIELDDVLERLGSRRPGPASTLLDRGRAAPAPGRVDRIPK